VTKFNQFFMSTTKSSVFTIACAWSVILLAMLLQAPPQDNYHAFKACTADHPERYCRSVHLQSTNED